MTNNNGSVIKPVRRFAGPLVHCSNQVCNSTIPGRVLKHKLDNGEKPQCKLCKRLFKLPPGAERLVTSNKPSANTSAAAAKQAEQIKKQQAELEKLKNKISQLENPKGEDEGKGYPKEEAEQLKSIGQRKKHLLGLSKEARASIFGSEERFQATLNELQEEKDQVHASSRAKLPLKGRYLKQEKFVAKLKGETGALKDKRHELLLEWTKLDDELDKKERLLSEEQLALSELASKVAEEAKMANGNAFNSQQPPHWGQNMAVPG